MTENEAIKVIKRLVGISTPERIIRAVNVAVSALEEIQQYREIGTVEECQEAKERQTAKNPKFYAHNYYCDKCGNLVGNDEFKWKRFMYCDHCRQQVLWEK